MYFAYFSSVHHSINSIIFPSTPLWKNIDPRLYYMYIPLAPSYLTFCGSLKENRIHFSFKFHLKCSSYIDIKLLNKVALNKETLKFRLI